MSEYPMLNKKTVSDFKTWLESAGTTGGIALIDKDLNWTSFDVIAKLRSQTKIKKIGHAGTLDPLATGLLIIAFGKATKSLSEFQSLNKTYSGIIKFGATTKTDDSEAEEENITDVSGLDLEEINKYKQQFIGRIEQVPPQFSAKKIGGQKMYELARKNITSKPQPSSIEIFSFNIVQWNRPYLYFNIICSKGTYIRSIARDFGIATGTGAYLYQLRRTSIGGFNANDSFTIDNFCDLMSESN